ncbi:MAG: hypothetical protein JXA21_23255 [Anaerolineae bacterium]|nr:hypothetical protein [Anaerolineae bacterium]
MKLSRKDYEFNNTKICHIMPKHIELDRVLINLYMLLKYDGRRPVVRGKRREVDMDYIVEQLIQQHGDSLRGFRDHREEVRDWVYSDLVDMVFRGVPDREKVAAPLPLHLNAYKLRNPSQASDYRGSEHIYSMIYSVDPSLVKRLKDFLGQGMDAAGGYDAYDGETPLDLDTLTIVRMVDAPHFRESPSGEGAFLDPPLCVGQARLLCSDLRRLLAYQSAVPRRVLISYLRTAMGLHLGLYLLRLFHQLSGWVQDKAAHPACINCPVDANSERPFAGCPFAFQNPSATAPVDLLLVDMGEDYTHHMAMLSRDNCAQHYTWINDYIHAVLTVNQVKRFAESDRGRRHLQRVPEDVPGWVALLAQSPQSLQNYFSDRLDEILPRDQLEQERDDLRAVYAMENLSPLQRFIEIVALERTRYYRKYLTQQLDAVLMKNQDTCLLRQGKGRRNERRWHIGSQLLEMLVQIAVLEPYGQYAGTKFRSRPILIDGFTHWLQERYGLVLMPAWPDATIQDYAAFNANLGHLKRKLREIGFYTDLSDAYNAQVILPRYPIELEEVV